MSLEVVANVHHHQQQQQHVSINNDHDGQQQQPQVLPQESIRIPPRQRQVRSWTTIPSTWMVDPDPETHTPMIDDGTSHPLGVTVLPASASQQQEEEEDGEDQIYEEEEIHVDIMKTVNPQQAYVRIKTKPEKSLDYHGRGWGSVYFGFIVHRVPTDDSNSCLPTFQAPQPDTVEYVAIKRLRKSVVHDVLQRGGHENPYVEISRMQQYGDNIHVLGCIEALQDPTYLYIITPYCDYGTLFDCITWRQPAMIPEDQVRIYYRQLLQAIQYLHRHGICHRDLSPDNCMVYHGRLVLTDLAMSFRIPQPRQGRTTTTMYLRPQGRYGKSAYLPPEVYLDMPYNPYGCDVWASTVILFNMVTGEMLYEQPIPENLNFRYFLLAQGINTTSRNEQAMEILMDFMNDRSHNPTVQRSDPPPILLMIQKILQLSPEVLELLQGVLQVTPHERWTLDQIEHCAWMQQ